MQLVNMIPKISEECIGCGACVSICPKQVLQMKDRKAYVSEPNKCDQLWGCIQMCPVGAITKTKS